MWVGEGSTSLKFNLKKCHKAEYEYKQHMHAPRKGLAPPLLIFQTSPSCNIFTKISRIFRNWSQPLNEGLLFCRFWLIFGHCYPDSGEIHARPSTRGWH